LENRLTRFSPLARSPLRSLKKPIKPSSTSCFARGVTGKLEIFLGYRSLHRSLAEQSAARLRRTVGNRPAVGSGKMLTEAALLSKPSDRCHDTCRPVDHRTLRIFQSNRNFLPQPVSCDTAESGLPLDSGRRDHGNSRHVRVHPPPMCSCIEYTGILRVSWVPPGFAVPAFHANRKFSPDQVLLSGKFSSN